MPAMVDWARSVVAGSNGRRWSVRGGVPTLERGGDQTLPDKAGLLQSLLTCNQKLITRGP